MQQHKPLKKSVSTNLFWDTLCCTTLIGIWPRFIEPKRLVTTHKTLRFKNLPKPLHGVRILQFSDLHFHAKMPKDHLKKILRTIDSHRPDIVLFTGDMLCFGEMPEQQTLLSFLKAIEAPNGCFACLGNHDYNGYIGLNDNGDYDIIPPPKSSVMRGFKRLFQSITLTKSVGSNAQKAKINAQLNNLFEKSPFQLLQNKAVQVPFGNAKLNICGFGEHMAGNINPHKAYQNYDARFPGILLLHNPDGIPSLLNFPGNAILCGHTHGGQVNLPFLWKKFCKMENPQFKSGAHQIDDKWIYVNRGVGSTLPFRLFSPPELLLLTLESQ